MNKIRFALQVFKTLVKDSFQYPDRLLVDTVGVIARCGILLILYWKVFQLNNGVINGTTFLFAAWSIFFYFSFSLLRFRDISRLIMQDIQTGTIEVLLCKPVNYLLYRMLWQIGLGIYSFSLITVLSVIVLSFVIGFPSTMLVGMFLPSFILTLFLGSILSLFIYSIVGLLAFWIEDINPVFWMVDKAVMILGGSYLSISLFPSFMYKLALYSPFGASQFVTHTVYENWQFDWYKLLGIQLFWILFLGCVLHFLFKKAKQRVSVNGG